MTLTAFPRAAILAAIVAIGMPAAAVAQTPAADPHHPDATSSQATPSPETGDMTGQGQSEQPAQPGMMPPGMMAGT